MSEVWFSVWDTLSGNLVADVDTLDEAVALVGDDVTGRVVLRCGGQDGPVTLVWKDGERV